MDSLVLKTLLFIFLLRGVLMILIDRAVVEWGDAAHNEYKISVPRRWLKNLLPRARGKGPPCERCLSQSHNNQRTETAGKETRVWELNKGETILNDFDQRTFFFF